MIPTIRVMVGSYILTRMLSFLSRKGDRAESVLVRVFAVITIWVTALSIGSLLSSSLSVPNLP